jgi:alkaline phosphatase D
VPVDCDIAPPATPERRALEPVAADATAADERFPQGVASGGPTPTGAILWTRVAPGATGDLYVEVGPDEGPTADGRPTALDPTYRGVVPGGPDPAADHTVRVDLDGHLDSGTAYRYRFVHGGVASPVGRVRTLPSPDASPDAVSFAVLACQDYQNGYYGALGHVARADVDYLLHLGDYVYDSADGRYRGLGSEDYPDRGVDLPSGEAVAHSLADFRAVYRTYLSDPNLRAALAAHTAVRTWDDHAVADNRFWDYDRDAPVLPSHPRGDDPAFARALTAAGIQAFYEYTPARVDYDRDADRLHDAFRLYRALDFGDLLRLFVTDERLFRSPPPCRDDLRPGWLCPERTDPGRTMLGTDQHAWLTDGFAGSDARWTGWANEVLSLPFRVGVGSLSLRPLTDSWDGYAAERAALFRTMAGNDRTAFVTLTGDLHSTVVGDQRVDGSLAGVECMTPATTSVNVAEAVGAESGLARRLTRPLLSGAVEAANPGIDRFESHSWGYGVARFDRDRFRFDVYAVDKTADRPDPPRTRIASVERSRDRLIRD